MKNSFEKGWKYFCVLFWMRFTFGMAFLITEILRIKALENLNEIPFWENMLFTAILIPWILNKIYLYRFSKRSLFRIWGFRLKQLWHFSVSSFFVDSFLSFPWFHVLRSNKQTRKSYQFGSMSIKINIETFSLILFFYIFFAISTKFFFSISLLIKTFSISITFNIARKISSIEWQFWKFSHFSYDVCLFLSISILSLLLYLSILKLSFKRKCTYSRMLRKVFGFISIQLFPLICSYSIHSHTFLLCKFNQTKTKDIYLILQKYLLQDFCRRLPYFWHKTV